MANDEENHALVADEEDLTEFALMAKTSAESEVFDNSLCSKACKKNTDSLNSKIIDLDDKLGDAKNMIYHYKLGLAQVEARLAEHRNQKVKYCEKIRILEFKTEFRANCIENLTKELELIKKEKEGLDTKLAGFQTASKDLDSLLKSQRLDKNKEGPTPTIESSPDDAQNKNPSGTETEASPSTILSKHLIKFVKATDRSTETKIAKVETAKPTVKYAAMYSKPSKSSNVRGNQRNWNNLKSHQLGVKKGRTCPTNSHKTISPRTVIHKPHRPSMRSVKPNIKFPTVRKLPTINRKFPTGNIKFSTADMGNKGKAVKASTCWFWKPSQNLSNKGNISYLSDYEPFDGGYVSFGQGGCKITGKGTIKTECIVLGRNFKLSDDANVLLRTPRQHNMYSIDLNNIFPHKDLTCLVAKASADECMLWHKRLVFVVSASLKGLFVVSRLSYESTSSLKELLEVSYRHGILFADKKPGASVRVFAIAEGQATNTSEFPDVFPDELPGIPPVREVEFNI
nr:ribonuclease H-like domain-containing protein [Tanacetum cinerariifolium]